MLSRLSIRARITIGSVLAAAVLLSVGLWLVREQVNSFADTLADGDPQLRERLRLFKSGDQ